MVHTHVHSMYSLRDSIIKPDELIARLKEIGHTAVAITDHGASLGGVSIYKQLKEANIKYIHGCELYLCDDLKIKDKNNKYYHLIVLCKNDVGRVNLNHLISISNEPQNKYIKPRVDFSLLKQYKEGLIVTSACMAGEISKLILNNDVPQAKAVAQKYKNEFGEDFYLEIQAHNEPTQIALNKTIVSIANELEIPLIVTTDAHYVYEEDRKYQNKHAFNGAYKEDGEAYVDCFIQTEEEIRQRLSYLPLDTVNKAIYNTDVIADRCNVEMPLSAPIMPKVSTPSNVKSNVEWLHSLCKKGFANKLNIDYDTKTPINNQEMSQSKIEEYITRYKYELNALEKMHFVDYILLVYSYANVPKRRGIARGSGGGSLINYLTNITDIDPIEHGLYFERFIDVGALAQLEEGKITAKELKIPDIDLDFSEEGCKQVLKYLYDTYGEEKVASIGKFGTNKTKGTIRDLCKVLNIDLQQADKIAKSFEDFSIEEIDSMISGEIKTLPSAKEAIEYVKNYPELFDYVRKLNGLPKSFGLHACFPSGTMVHTENEYKAIEDVSVGDKVLTHKNRYMPVVRTTTKETCKLSHMRIVGGKEITSTPSHRFLIKKRLNQKPLTFSTPRWVRCDKIQKGDLVAMSIDKKQIVPVFKDLPTHTPDFWWTVGRYIGDGWCENPKNRNEKRVIICCSKKKNSELRDIVTHIQSIFTYRIEETSTTFKIFLKSNDMFDFLQQFGKYAHKKELTDVIFHLPKNFLENFLVGYFSADGYVDKNGYQTFKTVSYKLALGLMYCVAKCYNRHCSITLIKPKTEIILNRVVHSKEKYMVSFTREQRKREHCFYENDTVWLYVKSVEITTTKPIKVYDLSVLDDNSYTVENVTVHNCGKVVATRPLDEFLPSSYDAEGVRFLQGDMHDVEDVGLVKVDILGLRTIDHEYDCLELAGETKDFINPRQSFQDPKVLDIFKNGDTVGIFQMSSAGMKQTLKKMNVQSINDLAVANALFRPGSLKYIDNFCDRRSGKESFDYLHPDLEPILKSTYGIMVFQEQLIEIGRLAKISNPDLLRKATGKKDARLLAIVKPELETKLKARGWSDEQFSKLWDDMIEFSKYSFNKSHASAYAIIAYMTAKEKAYYPAEFYSALCNSYIGESSFVKDDVKEIVDDIDRHNIRIAKFDWRKDHRKCHVDNGEIVWAIPLIKDCSISTAETLWNLAKEFTYNHFSELAHILLSSGVPKNQLLILIKLGFFSEYGNSKFLLRVVDILDLLKNGNAVKISKEKIGNSNIKTVFEKHCLTTNSKGEPSKDYVLSSERIDTLKKQVRLLDKQLKKEFSVAKEQQKESLQYSISQLKHALFLDLITDLEQYIKENLSITEFSVKEQMATHKDYLGFVNVRTNKEEDRRKLIVNTVVPLESKFDDDHRIWAYLLDCTSIGSGKSSALIVKANIFSSKRINDNDVIYATSLSKNSKGYWYLVDYKVLNYCY